jgi:hypothetical protein
MYARSDYARFQNGLRRCRGFMTLPEGGFTRLPGTKYLGDTDRNFPARLMRFAFKDEDAVLLEWTDQLLRFWRNGSLVLEAGGVEPYTLQTPYSFAQAQRLQSLLSSDRIYLTEGEIAPHRLSRFALDNWTIEPTPFANGPFAPVNINRAKEITVSDVAGNIAVTTNFDLFDSRYIGVLFQLSEVNTTRTPAWSADISTSVGDQFYNSGNVYRVAGFDVNNGVTGGDAPTASIVGGAVTSIGPVQWHAFASDNAGGYPDWIAGETVRIGDRRWTGEFVFEVVGFAASGKNTGVNPPVHISGFWLGEKGGPVYEYLSDGSGIIQITQISGARSASADVIRQLPAGLENAGTYRWAEQAWSAVKGFPRAIGAYKQRHIYGGTPTEPRTIWHSVIGGTVDFSALGGDDEGFSYILDSDQRDNGEITYIVQAGGVLHIGTTAGEFVGSSTDADRVYAEETATYDSDTSIGSRSVAPVIVNGKVVFLAKSARKLITLLLGPEGKYEDEHLTQIARHILAPGAVKLVFQAEPVPCIWAVLSNGDLVGCTYILKQKVLGFHRHEVGGGAVVDVEVMPGDDGSSEVLELVVRRTINGQVRHFREQMQPPFVDLDGDAPDIEDAWHLFAGVKYKGPATDEISGLDHLEGEVVAAWTEYGAFTGLSVAGGRVSLPQAVTWAIVGIDGSDGEEVDTLDMRVGTPDGGDEGRNKSHRASGIHVHRSAGGTFSVVQVEDGVEIASRPEDILPVGFADRVILRSGVFDLAGHKGWAKQSFFRFKPQPGAPLTILARTPTMMVSDD